MKFENPQFWDTIFLYDFIENFHIKIHFEKTTKMSRALKKMHDEFFSIYFLDWSFLLPTHCQKINKWNMHKKNPEILYKKKKKKVQKKL